MKVEFRPTIAADLAVITDKPLPHRIKSITAVLGDLIVGVGGIGYRSDGTVIAFAHITQEFRRYPKEVHRAGRLGMALIRRSGVPVVVAEAQPGNPAAERWLKRFGFVHIGTSANDKALYAWERP